VPPADAVQEFKVETASFDAQQGHSVGAAVNVALRSGTNSLHGTVYEFVRNDVLSANDFFLNRTNLVANPRATRIRMARRIVTRSATTAMAQQSAAPSCCLRKLLARLAMTVVTGLSSSSLTSGSRMSFLNRPNSLCQLRQNGTVIFRHCSAVNSSFQVYNPFTARAEGARIRRDPFPGNIIPANMISPIAKAYLQYYPLPNQPGDSQGRNNFISGQPRTDTFHSESYRFDQTLSDKQKVILPLHA
jgi:hypothetical protein